MLNIDTKILTKPFAEKIRNGLPSIIKCDQSAYVVGRFIGEYTRLISDILEMTKNLNIEGYLLTMDIQKAFDSVDHDFFISALKKFGFGSNFISWVKIVLKSQESCVMNGGFSTGFFNLERGTRQGDPISVYFL